MLICEKLLIKQGAFSLRADVQIGQGVTAIMGPSGAGKSTLLGAIAGFVPQSSGRISISGQVFSDQAPADRPVSILFQDNNLFPHLSIAENVGLGLRPVLRLTGAERDKVQAALEEVGLGGMADRKPAALSGGQQSRAALARVLLSGKAIVLLDEPFSALGPRLKDEMLDLVRDRLVPLGRTIVMVSHDPNDAKRIAERVCVVANETVSPPLTTKVIFDNPPAPLRSYLSDME